MNGDPVLAPEHGNGRSARPPARLVLRLAAWCLALALLALPVIAVLTGNLAAGRWQVRQLELHAPLQRTTAAQVREVVMRHTGPGFFALPLADLRQDLQALPWVRSVQVRKRWPDTLVVRLHEHQPYAVWNDSTVVTRGGDLVPVPSLAGLETLPRLYGPAARLVEVVDFHARIATGATARSLDIVSVALSARGSWMLESRTGSRILLGRSEPAARLSRFADTVPALLARHPGHHLQRADLRYPNGYALSWQALPPPGTGAIDPDAAPPSASEPGRPHIADGEEDHTT